MLGFFKKDEYKKRKMALDDQFLDYAEEKQIQLHRKNKIFGRENEKLSEMEMGEIDKKMIDMLNKSDLMKRITNNVVNNPKLRIIIGDAKKYVLTCKEKYDMIIEDIEHDYTNNQMDVDYFDYYKQLLNISNVICSTWDDGDEDGMKRLCSSNLINTTPHQYDLILSYYTTIYLYY